MPFETHTGRVLLNRVIARYSKTKRSFKQIRWQSFPANGEKARCWLLYILLFKSIRMFKLILSVLHKITSLKNMADEEVAKEPSFASLIQRAESNMHETDLYEYCKTYITNTNK